MPLLALLALSTIATAEPGGAAMQPCLRAIRPLQPGQIAMSGDFARSTCATAPARAFRYSAADGLSRVSRAIGAGSEVAIYPEYGSDRVRPGDILHLIVQAGAVRIDRAVEALQTAKPGQNLFVRDRDGVIIAIRYRNDLK